jgi:hypothetical protein
LADSIDDEPLSLGAGLRPIGLKDVKAVTAPEGSGESTFVSLSESILPKVNESGQDAGQSGVMQVLSDRSNKNTEVENEQFNSLLEQRLAKVKAATVDISKQLDEIEPHFTPDPVDDI